jgi:hypothetical protein
LCATWTFHADHQAQEGLKNVQNLLQYVALSNAELEAAESAPNRDERIAHIEQAYRYARLAVEERAKQSSIFRWSGSASV